MNVKDSEIKDILQQYKSITIYGMSSNPSKPGLGVPKFMNSKGYDIVGVNPNKSQIENFEVFQQLKDVPLNYRKFVDVFRRPEFIPEVVEEVIEAGGVEVLWLQLGITHPEAEKKAENSGIKVISDRCLKIEYFNLK